MSEAATLYASINSQGAATGAAMFNAATRSMVAGARSVDTAVSSTVKGLTSLKTAMTGIGAGLVIKSVVEASDSFTNLRGRLDAILGSSTAAQAAMDGIAAAAARARTPSAELASTFTRVSMAADQLKLPMSDTIGLSETLAKAIKISGASGSEASAGMMQLAQAIASGKFQGDEFRSVAENLPYVMKILQEQTGKTAGELRKLAEEGKITGQTLVASLLNAQDDIDAKFSKLPETAGTSFELLTGEVTRLTGSLAEQSGVSKAWADVFDDVRASLKDPEVAAGLKMLTDGIASFGRIVSDTIPSAVSVLKDLGSVMSVVSDVGVFLKDFGSSFYSFGEGVAQVTGLDRAVSSVATTIREQFNADVATARARLEEAKTATDEFSFSAAKLGATMQGLDWSPNVAATDWAAGTSVQRPKREITFGPGTNDAAAKKAEREVRAMKEALEVSRLQNQLAEAKLNNDQSVTYAIENELEKRRAVTAELRKAHPELARQLEGEALIAKAIERSAAEMDDLRGKGEQFGDAIAGGLKSITLEGASLRSTLGSVVQKMADLVFQMTVAEPLAKGIGQALAGSGGFSSVFGTGAQQASQGFFSSALSSVGSFLGFADGGVFNSPVALSGAGGFRGVMAEAGPEAIMPLARGPDGALGVRMSGGGSAAPVTINVNVAGDATDATVMKIRAAARLAVAEAAPQLTQQAVSAVGAANRNNPRYLRR